MGNCSKKAIFLQLGIKIARRARKRGVLGIYKINYVVKTTELAERSRGVRRNVGVFGNHKTNYVVKTTELGRKPRAGRGNLGIFRDSQNELRCKNNGIGEETARRAQKLGVLGIYKTNYVVKTTEFAERPRGMRRNGVFSGFTKRITL